MASTAAHAASLMMWCCRYSTMSLVMGSMRSASLFETDGTRPPLTISSARGSSPCMMLSQNRTSMSIGSLPCGMSYGWSRLVGAAGCCSCEQPGLPSSCGASAACRWLAACTGCWAAVVSVVVRVVGRCVGVSTCWRGGPDASSIYLASLWAIFAFTLCSRAFSVLSGVCR